MASKQGNIELITLQPLGHVPSCPHGPTLLFERWDYQSKKPRRFYACSAFRDRKECSFFQWEDAPSKNLMSLHQTMPQFLHKVLRKRYIKFKKLPKNNRNVCCTCSMLLLDNEVTEHREKNHVIKKNVLLKELRWPSLLFTPLDDNKTFAQYLFSKSTIDFIIKTLHQLGYSHILCVGTPRIHEAVQNIRKLGDRSMSSMLLDLDERYAQFFPPALFTKYNMFNHHFFDAEGETRVRQFVGEDVDHVILITDPPFGGMVEALASSFLKLSQMRNSFINDEQDSLMPIVWFFPYFMESRILKQLPALAMLDYKVDYDNHNLFNNQHKKKGSPVRIFTNIPQAQFVLPPEEGYWFCQSCKRFSSQENKHCEDCDSCTSKDGTTYTHCYACMRCVKSSRIHCQKCKKCELKTHVCGQSVSAGCHICGDVSHKRRECPQRAVLNSEDSRNIKRAVKRKQSASPAAGRVKKHKRR
ncbi:rRNA N6-adenosine-methyltransferase ZCCHC4-like isoform X2 [Physella acuta]|uniref:rRNA N6-adenosine-methyltransferase ZCCHC4-like isoform X1 n=1 Tax=Physella acuta TaxID=109671 RepID=UPI0027DB2BF1|nr:rRNA N6-adenosine-methyltransferase ZCCHC4-like isoform X1 [Physella acuta]XP_059175436.1 rRNA N6-adenosine-methyltransferase ZCCHC4-like isoform X1 [Physella acuta]XP_059175437.1 rRNA N6-adenosine-methyltransferase ZCCHC4-like isoform X1 [Physella acuta]XP_059175438.1 rRNA N6-adenosine-methyltransferase ZCCHC4-like isoform X1 [Physella acuta]XP_059175439.1 rRNA N6-adenosine-methyltransferase ZCCHC4-like isoform X2 [Physella acuta]